MRGAHVRCAIALARNDRLHMAFTCSVFRYYQFLRWEERERFVGHIGAQMFTNGRFTSYGMTRPTTSNTRDGTHESAAPAGGT